MGYSVKGDKITLTRGDTMRLDVGITKDEEVYVPDAGDAIRFALKHAETQKDRNGYYEFVDTEPLLVKTIPNDTMVLELVPEDTKELKFGKYKYDCEITFADGTVDTFIENADFVLSPEVH